ncbi:MAG TPA: hypothetical protein RMH99_26900, partial [Sandaracinaceae bacterium LLY-WYZ-13_1]|nr:hypothetical protein [Sandaracinaceae bacterium LLY-WYZ-13_1]
TGRFNAVFGAAHAPAFPSWRRTHPEEQSPKTILRKHGYWYGWGWAGHLGLELHAPFVAVGGSLAWVTLDSQEGYDRMQGEVTHDLDGTAELLETGLWVRVHDLPLGLYLQGSWHAERRADTLEGVLTDRRLDRFQLAVGFEL